MHSITTLIILLTCLLPNIAEALGNNSTAKEVFLDKSLPKERLGQPKFHRIGDVKNDKRYIKWEDFVEILEEEADPTIPDNVPQLESSRAGDFRILSFQIDMTGENRGVGRLLVHSDDGVAVYIKKAKESWGSQLPLHARYKKGQAFPNIWGTTPVNGKQRPVLRSCFFIDYQLEESQVYDVLVLYSNTHYQKTVKNKNGKITFRDYDGFSAHVVIETKEESFNLTVDKNMNGGNKPLTAADENDEVDEASKSRCCIIDVTNNILL